MEGSWYVAQATCGLEATSGRWLDREGIESYCPMLERGRRVFPGYLLVRMADVEVECYVVNRARGIVRLLPVHREVPLALPAGFVEALREAVASGAYEEREQAMFLTFVREESLLPLVGAFRDRQGRFQRTHKGCGVLLYSLLGRDVEVEVPLHQLVRPGTVAA